jgi:hypothetical protein
MHDEFEISAGISLTKLLIVKLVGKRTCLGGGLYGGRILVRCSDERFVVPLSSIPQQFTVRHQNHLYSVRRAMLQHLHHEGHFLLQLGHLGDILLGQHISLGRIGYELNITLFQREVNLCQNDTDQ